MRTTTYKCDKCGAEDTDNKIWLLYVGVYVGSNQDYSSSYTKKNGVNLKQDWCYKCCIKTGLLEPAKGEKIEVTPITFEDLVQEIVYNAASEAIRNRDWEETK